MPPRVHLSFRVKDLSRSADFYQILLDEPPDKVKPGYVRFMPANAPILLSLLEDDSPGGGGLLDHLGIRMESPVEVDAARRRLEKMAIAMEVEEQVTCCWAVQNKLWLTDPDGHRWEIYTVTDEQPGRAESTPCCAPKDAAEPCCEPSPSGGCCG